MPIPSLKELSARLRKRVDHAARGSDVPAGIERGADVEPPTSSRERGRLRRRLRELRRLREAQLLELGALVLEAHKHDRDNSPVIKSKAAEAAATDAEARAVAEALDTEAGLETVVAAGIAGPCPTCGTLASTAARFCSTCGTPLDGRPDATPRTDADRADADYAAVPLARADAPPVDADQRGAAERHVAGAPISDATPDDAPTTELTAPAPNGNGASPSEDELEPTGRDA